MLGTIIFAVVLILLAAARVARAVLALSPLALLMRRHVFALTALAWAARG
jgi:hypothetical protein